jgi:HAD superfamily hydrolase (TIGR01549 family)
VTAPIRAVLLDFHSTLVDQGDATEWLAAGMARSGVELDPGERARAIARLDDIWTHARVIDPDSGRDHSAEAHAAVFHDVMRGHVDDELRHALYDVMLDMWWAYDDAAPLLEALRERGVRTAVLSNVGVDIRPVMARQGLEADAVILSCEVGAVKPQPQIFAAALDALGVPAEATLMVGDAWTDDGGAAALGIRTLILPRTRGRFHGLDAVLRLVD